jgi:hypothetical protein
MDASFFPAFEPARRIIAGSARRFPGMRGQGGAVRIGPEGAIHGSEGLAVGAALVENVPPILES